MSHSLPKTPRCESWWEQQLAEGDQQVCADALWRASIGLDLADRTVLEGEVLLWRIAQQLESQLHRSG